MGQIESQINGKYLEAHSRLRGEKPVDEYHGEYRKTTGTSNESLQLQINVLNSKYLELQAKLAQALSLVSRNKVSAKPEIPIPQSPIEEIIQLVSATEEIPRLELLSARRGRTICFARQMVFFLAATCTGRSLPSIGRSLGRDHTTILYGRDIIKRRRITDTDLDDKLRWYESKIKNRITGKNCI